MSTYQMLKQQQQKQIRKNKKQKQQQHLTNRRRKLSIITIMKEQMTKMSFLAAIIILIVLPSSISAGSCREAQLCCSGRDSSCVVQKAPINAIIEDLSDKPCYCDHACLKLGDCCDDFKDHCRVLDCQVSAWGQWSNCDKTCGPGFMTRTRQILQQPQNGGKHCPSLVQKHTCQGFHCHGRYDKRRLREIALLIPSALYRTHHSSNSSHGQHRDASKHHHDSNKHNHEQEYCIEFEVIRASKACRKLPPYNLMIEGDRIAVRCDAEALIADAPLLKSEDAAAKHENSTAKQNQKLHHQKQNAFTVEVIEETNNNNNNKDADSSENDLDSNNFGDSNSEESDEDEEDEDTEESSALAEQKNNEDYSTTTTTIATTATLATNFLNYHCRGEGLPGRTTHWNALPAPSCRGKWLRLTIGAAKKCSHTQFTFV